MKRSAIILLLPLLFPGNATTALENTTVEAAADVSDSVRLTISLQNHHQNSAFTQRIQLKPVSPFSITVTDVPSDVWFIVFQIHTFQYNATLAYDKTHLDRVSARSIFGSNIGLYFKTHNITAPIQVFLRHDNVYSLDVLLAIVTYGQDAPTPGGCNMEFDIEVAPYQKLHIENEMIIVDTQPASVLSAANGLPFPCDKNPTRYKMYRLYLPGQDFTPETYFEAITSMLTVQDIVRNGDQIPATLTSPMRRIYSAYTGTGSVYAAVATYGDYSAAYVPIFTYACSPLLYPESCQVLNDSFAKVTCALVLIVGCVSVIRGHRLAFIDGLLTSCMMGGIFGYILIVATSNLVTEINILIGLMCAILAAVASAVIKICFELSSTHIPLGFLCACITYLYAPGWMVYVLEHDLLFWPLFLSLTLAVALLMTRMPYIADNLTRAIFGSYFVIIAIDYYSESNLKYIIVTLIRRVTIPGFCLAFVYPPHRNADIILFSIWFVLVIARFIIQFICCIIYKESTESNAEISPLLSNIHCDNYSDRGTNFINHPKRYRRYRRHRRSPNRCRYCYI